MHYNGPWLYGVASLRDLSVSNRDEPRGGEMQLVHHHHLAMTYEPLLGTERTYLDVSLREGLEGSFSIFGLKVDNVRMLNVPYI